jgi:hypothetical protein
VQPHSSWGSGTTWTVYGPTATTDTMGTTVEKYNGIRLKHYTEGTRKYGEIMQAWSRGCVTFKQNILRTGKTLGTKIM